MENFFGKPPGSEMSDTSRSSLSAEFGNMVAQLGGGEPPPFKVTGEGSSVLRPSELKPLLPKLEAPPKTDTPAGKAEAPQPRYETRDVKAKDVADALKNQTLPLNVVVSKVETAFKSETNKTTMEDLASRINLRMRGSGVSLDLKMLGNDPTKMQVTIQGIGRPYNIMIGPGTGRMEVKPVTGTDTRPVVAPPATGSDTRKPADAAAVPGDRAVVAKDVADTLKSKDIASSITKIDKAFKNEMNPSAMAELAKAINKELSGSGISVDLHSYRNSKFVMAVSILGAGRPLEIPVGAGKEVRWRR